MSLYVLTQLRVAIIKYWGEAPHYTSLYNYSPIEKAYKGPKGLMLNCIKVMGDSTWLWWKYLQQKNHIQAKGPGPVEAILKFGGLP